MKYSRQRELILDTVKNFPIHPTADIVYEYVRSVDPKISLGTVYRNLNRLSENGSLIKISMPIGGDRFDGRLDDHTHIICQHCGSVTDIELKNFGHIDEEVATQTGYQVTGHTIVFTGLCKECKTSS